MKRSKAPTPGAIAAVLQAYRPPEERMAAPAGRQAPGPGALLEAAPRTTEQVPESHARGRKRDALPAPVPPICSPVPARGEVRRES